MCDAGDRSDYARKRMLRKLWVEIRSSLWFVPGLLVFAGGVLAIMLVQIDVRFVEVLSAQRWQPWLNTGAEGARGMLTAIAGAMITVAGVAFSVTIVTLSLASSQYTPRIVRNFMRHRANQFVLGVFVAIYTYCLVVLRSIRGGSEENGGGFVPLVAVAFALVLALLSIGCLIFFIHHTATSIQASSILRTITRETLATIEVLFPQQLGEGERDEVARETLREADWQSIGAKANGYLQQIDAEGVLRFAREHEAVLRLECVPGVFVADGAPLVSVNRALKDDESDAVRALFIIGDFRTVDQDAGFGIRQIVDIAMKALSPGINDTSTAVSCLDYLSAILAHLARRRMVSPYRGEEGALRVIAPAPSFEHFVAKTFDQIRHFAEGNVTILGQLLRAIQRVAAATGSESHRQVLQQHANLVRDLADRSVVTPYDRAIIERELVKLRTQLQASAEELRSLS